MNFNYIREATGEQQIRAWAVEETIAHFDGRPQSGQDIVNVAKMLENYVTTGDVTSTIIEAVQEGFREGLFLNEHWRDTVPPQSTNI